MEADFAAIAAAGAQLLRTVVREELISVVREELGRLVHPVAGSAEAGESGSRRMWLTPEQIATDLDIAVATVWSWIRSGALAASQPHASGKKGRLYFVHRDTLDAFLRAHVTTADEEGEAARPAGEAARILGRLAARSNGRSAATASK